MTNEGGCGTSPMAHVTEGGACPARQGLFGILEVFVDTTLICTLTALAILTACPAAAVGGAASVRLAFSTVFPVAGGPLLALLLFFFAYATILCQAFYGEVCLFSLTRARGARPFFFVAFSLCLLLGAIGTPSLVWSLSDLLLALMTFSNLYLLLREKETILRLTREGGFIR